jgi:hypothetical protein
MVRWVDRVRSTRPPSWASRLVVVAAVAGLLAAGMSTAILASSTPTAKNGGNQPNHTKPPKPPPQPSESSESEPEPPPPPPPPPDPLEPPTTAPSTSVTPNIKEKEAAKNLRSILVGTASFLGDCLTPTEGSDTTDPVLCYVAALAIIKEAIAAYKIWKDPPDPNFTQVALGMPDPVPAGGFKCPKRAKRSDCAAVTAALRKYVTALTVNAQAVSASAVTLERFSGAVQANSVPGALLQAAAQKAYAGLTVSTKAAQQAAGVALGLTLRRTHLDRRPTKSQFHARVNKLSTSKGYPRQVIQRLIADKQIGSAADLDAILKEVMPGVPYVSLSRGVSLALTSTASAELWHTITVKDLAVLIRGLVAQNAAPAAIGDTLLDELRAIANAADAGARKPLIDKLVKDAGAVSGPAGILLSAGAGGLS